MAVYIRSEKILGVRLAKYVVDNSEIVMSCRAQVEEAKRHDHSVRDADYA